jgi:nucleoside-diphosphate-sugar epimerase
LSGTVSAPSEKAVSASSNSRFDRVRRILVTGATGQIGSELTLALRGVYGAENVVASNLHLSAEHELAQAGPWKQLDVTDRSALEACINEFDIDTVVNLAAILSATGEKEPQLCWQVNVGGLINTLEAARSLGLYRVLCPSSIAVFGPDSPHVNTPQETVLRPSTMYGVTKVTGELLCDYYFQRFGVDARGLRYPGIISHATLPGGGTTDYAVEIFHEALKKGSYTCFLGPNTALPMMYMPDCLKATIDLADADFAQLKHHTDFNVGSMSFTVAEQAASIRKFIPDFEIEYAPDFRQDIADSWPDGVDDSCAREEWGWAPSFDLDSMTKDMLEKLRVRFETGILA